MFALGSRAPGMHYDSLGTTQLSTPACNTKRMPHPEPLAQGCMSGRPQQPTTGEATSLSLLQQKLLTLESRRQIYECVQRVPGVHLRKLARALNKPISSVEHHVHVLERHGLLHSTRVGSRRHVFGSGNGWLEDASSLHLLQNEHPRRILETLLKHTEMDHQTLVGRVDISPSTVSYHAGRLARAGLLVRICVGRNTWYQVADVKHARQLIDQCEPNAGGNQARSRSQPVPPLGALKPDGIRRSLS